MNILPITTMHYKLRGYRLILNLSFTIKMKGKKTKSPNKISQDIVLQEALLHIEIALPKLICEIAIASTSPN